MKAIRTFIVLSICMVVTASCGKKPIVSKDAIDVPANVDIGVVSGMRALLENDQQFKLLIYGETEQHGGIRLTPLSFGAVDSDGDTRITEATEVILDKPPTPIKLRCYRGTISCRAKEHKVVIDLEVLDDGKWKPFGWNGEWPLENVDE